MRRHAIVAIYSLASIWLLPLSALASYMDTCSQDSVAYTTANNTAIAIQNTTDNSLNITAERYTFSDFFDALDLPTVVGVGVTPNGIEGATFNSSMRLAWRHHKSYGVYAFISYDTHSSTYDSLYIEGSNVYSGEIWYSEIGLGVGYRIPLVKDIQAFYENPYFNRWDFFMSIEPGVSIQKVKSVTPYTDEKMKKNDQAYVLEDRTSVVPILRMAAGVEWFIMSNFGVFVEAAYVQHLTPTVIEKAAIQQGKIHAPSGPLVFSIGLSLFFQ